MKPEKINGHIAYPLVCVLYLNKHNTHLLARYNTVFCAFMPIGLHLRGYDALVILN